MSLITKLLGELEKSRPGLPLCGPNCPFGEHIDVLRAPPSKDNFALQCHFVGHMIDAIAGQHPWDGKAGSRMSISQTGIEDELLYIYNDLNNPALNDMRRRGKAVEPGDDAAFQGFSPAFFGCDGWEAKVELMAEAVRAYLQDPNYIKTVAWNTAKRIRATVNPHPGLKYIIQFN